MYKRKNTRVSLFINPTTILLSQAKKNLTNMNTNWRKNSKSDLILRFEVLHRPFQIGTLKYQNDQKSYLFFWRLENRVRWQPRHGTNTRRKITALSNFAEFRQLFASGTAMSLTVLDTVFTPDTLRVTKCHIWQMWTHNAHNVTHIMWNTQCV